MRKYRRLIAAVSVAALVVAACGDDSSTGGATAASSGTTPAGGDTTASASEPTTGGQAPTGDPIKIGVSMPLSGAIALPQIIDGYQAAVDDVNSAGGIAIDGEKRPVELVVLDNRSDLNTMTDQIRSLVLEDDVAALLGGCCQFNISAVPLVDSLKVPFVWGALPLELAPPTTGYSWGSFQVLGDASTQFFDLANTVETNKKVAFVGNNDEQSAATLDSWKAVGESQGYSFDATGAMPVGSTDFAGFIQDAISADADVLIAAMTPPDCFAMWKQMEALAYKPVMAIGLQCAQTPGWQELGKTGDGTLVVLNWTPQSGLPETDMITERFSDKYKVLLDISAVPIGYHEAQILLDAIASAGSSDREAINAALAATEVTSTLGPVKFDDKQVSATPTFIGQWQDGDAHQVWPAGAGVEPIVVPVSGLQ